MIFPTCCSPGSVIENWALNNKFYVCTECKKEVSDELPPPVESLSDGSSRHLWTLNSALPTPLSVEEHKRMTLDFVDFWIETAPNNLEKDEPDNG